MSKSGDVSKRGTSTLCLLKFKHDDDWNVHCERLEQFFKSNSVNDEVRKISFFISSVSQKSYQILRILRGSVLPSNYETYDELRELMKKHYSAKFSVSKVRKQFYNLQQLNSESITQWYALVLEGAVLCNFGGQLKERLKDQFIAGMKVGEILEKVYEEDHAKTLQEIFEIALKQETLLEEAV